MILDRLVLKNFKRFKNEEIHFRDGITGILGNNGTGKSSLVQAIFFALYGVQATGISADYIVSSFAGPKDKCEVRLDFRIGGDLYSVVRIFKKGKTVTHDASFHREGKLMATGVSQVETEVRRTLGMGPVDFRNTVYAGQKDLLTLLETTPGKRKEWFQKALGIDYLNVESQKILKERIDTKADSLKTLEGELRALSERQSEEDLPALLALVAGFEANLAELRSRHEELRKKKMQSDAALAEFSERKTEYTKRAEREKSLAAEITGLLGQQESIKKKIAGLSGLDAEYRSLEERLAPLPQKKLELETLRKKKTESDSAKAEHRFAERETGNLRLRLDQAAAKVAALDSEREKISRLSQTIRENLKIGPEITDAALESAITSRTAELMHAIGTLSARQDRLVAERKKLLADWDTIRNAGAEGTCPLCRQKLGTHYGEIEKEFETKLEAIQDEAVEVCGEQEILAAEKDRIAREKQNLAGLRSLLEKQATRETLEAERNVLEKDYAARSRAVQVLAEKIAGLAFDEAVFEKTGQDVAGLEKLQARFNELGRNLAEAAALKNQAVDLDRQINEKQANLAELKNQIARSIFDPAQGPVLEQARSEIDAALRTMDAETARVGERLLHTNEKIENNKKVTARIDELRKESESRREEIELLKLTRTIIADYVIYLMQVVRSRIESEVGQIISEITGGRYEQVLLDDDFNLLVRDIDNDYPIERFSGGEQDDIAVALRIALSRYLAGLHHVHESTLLIFDEIFGSQDEERRTNLLTTLRALESRFPQIILISHIPEIHGEFANTLAVEMGSDNASRVREVE